MVKKKDDTCNRFKAIKNYEEKLEIIQRSIKFIHEIPVDVPVIITQETWTGVKKKEVAWVVIPRYFNRDSVRCYVLAVEQDCYPVFHIKKMEAAKHCGEEVRDEDSMVPIRFQGIIGWRLWEIEDGPLTVNYAFISDEYRKMAFGVCR